MRVPPEPIKAILESIYSKRDRNGNCYWAFRYTDTATGKQVTGNISGGESNIRSMLRPLGLDSETTYSTIIEMPIREFNKLTKPWGYAGCTSEELAKYVRTKLAE